jgi:tetratricopeptide (TPR) repeat protein
MRFAILNLLAAMLLISVGGPTRAAEQKAEKRHFIAIKGRLPKALQQGIGAMEKGFRHLEKGDEFLFKLRTEEAIREYRAMFSVDPGAGQVLANRLATVHLVRGEYTRAAEQLETSVKEFPDWCGVSQAGRELDCEVIRGVWLAAASKPEEADLKLRRIINREAPALQRPPSQAYDEWSRELASKEASLVLGARLLQLGQRDEAKRLLAQAATLSKGEGTGKTRVRLAQAYLKQPEPTKP